MSRRYTNVLLTIIAILLAIGVSRVEIFSLADTARAQPADVSTVPQATQKENSMQLGNFSVSLAVKDIAASRAFY